MRTWGPYEYGKRWRVVTLADNGERITLSYKTELEAREAIAELTRSDPRLDAQANAMLGIAVALPKDPVWVYFLRDVDGKIVYVGMTMVARVGAHQTDDKELHRVFIVPTPFERPVAARLKEALIRLLQPKLNRHFAGNKSGPMRSHDDPDPS